MPFHTLIIAPRLDLTYGVGAVAGDLAEFMEARQSYMREPPGPLGYHKGDYYIWSLVVEDETCKIANIWSKKQTKDYRIYTCMDSTLLGM